MGISISSAVVPVKGIVISQNVFKGEGMDIAVNVSNGASAISAHFNSFFGEIAVGNLGAGSINATANWWKCSKGPGANGCSATSGSNIDRSRAHEPFPKAREACCSRLRAARS